MAAVTRPQQHCIVMDITLSCFMYDKILYAVFYFVSLLSIVKSGLCINVLDNNIFNKKYFDYFVSSSNEHKILIFIFS